MRALRTVALGVIGGVLAIGLVLDREEGGSSLREEPVLTGVPELGGGVWFCAGGSDTGGQAAVGLELVNVGDEQARAEISAFRSDLEVPPDPHLVVVEPRSRATVSLPELAPGSPWVGAVVEVFEPGVVVEQTYDSPTGTDRAPCFTRTGEKFIVPDGATRELSEGEQMVLLLLNPFHEDAVVDIAFDADVGPDSLESVVVPARRVLAIDVTDEVTVASRVSARIDVASGRLVVSRLQIRDGEEVRGLTVTPAISDGAAVSVLPSAGRGGNRRDVITVTNPSLTEVAEVDLEILTDGTLDLDPIELTVRPGRTVRVDLSIEARLVELEEFGILARSLTGVPVAVMAESTVPIGGEEVPGVGALPALDAAATGWITALDGESSVVSVANPSTTEIATIDLSVVDADGVRSITSVELEPGRRTSFAADELGGDRLIVLLDSTAPVVVSREVVGFTSRQAAGSVISTSAVLVESIG